MQRTWTAMSVLLLACASGQAPEAKTAASVPPPTETPSEAVAASSRKGEDASHDGASATANAAKTTPGAEPAACTPVPNAKPKVVTGEDAAVDFADAGYDLVLDVAGIAVQIPACTPDADIRMITASWETKERPIATRIHPQFTRHAATLRVDRELTAPDGSPILVRLKSKRELVKHGEKLVLAVERSGECDEQHKRDKLEFGDCSHWYLYDAEFDAERNEMVARIPSTGGYRLQFGWVPNKKK